MQQVAREFRWIHGKSEVLPREDNVGLVQQWYNAFIPANDREMAFIFEDDMEVSPMFFTWAKAATSKYYTDELRSVHWELLNAVRGLVAEKPWSAVDYLEQFVRRYPAFHHTPVPTGPGTVTT